MPNEPQKALTVAAISDPKSYGWKVLVEIDFWTLRELCPTSPPAQADAPKPGTVFDLQPILLRLESLESRERDAKKLGELLAKLQPKPEAPEAPQS